MLAWLERVIVAAHVTTWFISTPIEVRAVTWKDNKRVVVIF